MNGSERSSVGESFGMFAVGGLVGFALYLLATSRGFGARGGGGGGSRWEGPTPVPVAPKDDARLVFVMIEPTAPGNSAVFHLVGDASNKIYSIDALIARVKDGGRTDVQLRPSGAVIQRAWEETRDLIKRSGLTVWVAETPSSSPHVVGYARGSYGRRYA